MKNHENMVAQFRTWRVSRSGSWAAICDTPGYSGSWRLYFSSGAAKSRKELVTRRKYKKPYVHHPQYETTGGLSLKNIFQLSGKSNNNI
jgi:hypothetical protein